MNLRILKNKDFLLLILGSTVSFIGTRMQNFALSLYILKITGSATQFATILSISFIPELILGPIAGVFADWLNRKKMIVYLDILSGILVGVYAVIYFIDSSLINLFSLSILVILLSIISTIFRPAIVTVTPSIVEKKDLVDANSMNTMVLAAGRIGAPIIAAALLEFYGLFLILIFNSISFIISALSEIFINIPPNNKKPDKINLEAFTKDFKEGIMYIKNNNTILGISLILLFLNFFTGSIITIGMPYIIKSHLQATDIQFGIFQSALVMPMFISPIFCGIISKKFKSNKIVIWSMLINSALFIILGSMMSNIYIKLFNNNLIPMISAFTIFFIVSIINLLVNIIINSMEQEIVPISMLGRVDSAIVSVVFALMPLGQMIYGFLFDKFSPCFPIIIGGFLTAISTIFINNYMWKNKV